MKIKSLIAACAALALVACGSKEKPYNLTASLGDDANGKMAKLENYDTSEAIDSVIVVDGNATFTGVIGEPIAVRLTVDGRRAGDFILEPGDIAVADRQPSGTALNDILATFQSNVKAKTDSLMEIYQTFDSTTTPEQMQAFGENANKLLNDYQESVMIANINNPVGTMLFTKSASEYDAAKFNEMLTKYPHLANLTRVAKIKASFDAREATSAGKQYTDFTVGDKKLSDYIEPGKYTLVDMWASWCGPCKKEIEVIKELYAKYHEQGLNVVGVTVWEDPAQTEAYLAANPIPWNIILDAQNVPTDAYGVNGIPCIILIGPDGKIVARDLFEDELRAAVETAMAPKAEETPAN